MGADLFYCGLFFSLIYAAEVHFLAQILFDNICFFSVVLPNLHGLLAYRDRQWEVAGVFPQGDFDLWSVPWVGGHQTKVITKYAC